MNHVSSDCLCDPEIVQKKVIVRIRNSITQNVLTVFGKSFFDSSKHEIILKINLRTGDFTGGGHFFSHP